MSKYRKLPVVIEAHRLGDDGWPDSIWAGVMTNKIILHNNPNGPFWADIDTLEGRMQASEGDYIIKGVNGEFYPCKPDIFNKTYEAVADE